jgi:hypothetical protein
LAAQVKVENYVWQVGVRSGALAPVTFLVGYPKPVTAIAPTTSTSSEPSLVK